METTTQHISTAEACDAQLARIRERIARQQAQALISPTPAVEPINSALIQAPVASVPAINQFTPKTQFPAPVPATDAPTVVAADITSAEKAESHAGLDASSESLRKLGFKWMGDVADKVLLVIVLAIKAGRMDVTRTELRPLYNAHFNDDKSDGWISARVKTLLDQNRVFLRPQRRLCTVSKSGIEVGALYVVMKQEQIRWS